MELVLLWFVLAVVVAVVAEGRGRSGVGFFFLSLLLSPLIGLILVLAFSNLKAEALRRQEREEDKRLHQAVAARSVAGPPASSSVADELAKLADLRAKGVIDDFEFQAQKRAVLASRAPPE